MEKVIVPSIDFSGTWRLDFSRFDVKNTGGLPPEDWSYTKQAQQAMGNFSFEQNPELDCHAVGIPRGTIYPCRTNFSRDSDSIRIQKERIEESRVIWLDQDAEGLKN